MNTPTQPSTLLAEGLNDAIFAALYDSFAAIGRAAGLDPVAMLWRINSMDNMADYPVADVAGIADDQATGAAWAELLNLRAFG